jgi:undecaprenyl diphosphate synthase
MSSLPLRHIAIIMDGNGRWAKQRGLSRSEGHRAGTEAVRAVITECRSMGLPHLTLYAFSKENWNRPLDEVHFLFDLLVDFLGRELEELRRQNIRLLALGESSELPLPARKTLERTCLKTRDNTAMVLNLALNYSGRFELARACRRLVEEGADPASVTPERLAEKLYTAGQPDPDLIIRTSGEKRISNFLLFQCAYSEFYFTDTLWPDFTAGELRRAIADYAGRSRRFGATGDTPPHEQ